MKYLLMADMTCVEDITTCCSDYGIATYLYIVKQALDIIHIVVPIILVLMVTIDLVKMVISPDDPQKKKSRSLLNKFFAAILVFFIPFIVNLLFNLIDGFGLEISGCWRAAETIVDTMENTETYDSDLGEEYEDFEDPGQDITLDDDGNNDNNDTDVDLTGKNTGEKMVIYGKQFLGNPYVYGGTSLTNGIDCSAFTQALHKEYGITIPRTAATQASYSEGKTISSIENAKPGDLLFYKNSSGVIGHVSMYMGNNKVIHASNAREGIKISEVGYRTYSSIKRFW